MRFAAPAAGRERAESDGARPQHAISAACGFSTTFRIRGGPRSSSISSPTTSCSRRTSTGSSTTTCAACGAPSSRSIRAIPQHCVGFDRVTDVTTFIDYVKRCQVETTFYFNGSSDEPLAVQLKSLYLKQELAKFAAANQGKSAADLQAAFKEFVARVQPANLARPTWKPGAYHLDRAVLE